MKTYTRFGLIALLYFMLLAPFTWYLIRSWGLPATKMIFYSLEDPEEIVNLRRALGPIVSWIMVCATFGGTFNFLLMKRSTYVFLGSSLTGILLGILCFDCGAAWELAKSLTQNTPFEHETPNLCLLVGSTLGFFFGFLGVLQKPPTN